jgi:hypothetical protein
MPCKKEPSILKVRTRTLLTRFGFLAALPGAQVKVRTLEPTLVAMSS